MKRRPRDIGTADESAVVKVLVANGFPQCERRAMRGAHDAGDLTGTPGICWSVKGGEMARTASDLDIERWLGELATQMRYAKADVGVLVMRRKAVGEKNAHRWWAVMPASQHANLTGDPYPTTGRLAFPVRMLLADAVTLLRAAGYGEPEPDPNACDTPGHPSRPSGWCPICHGEEDERAAALAELARPVVAPYRPAGALTATDTHLPELETTR